MTTQGPHGRVVVGAVAICPNCDLPSFLADDYQMPPKSYGSPVEHVPAEVAALYAEACEAMTGGAPTAAAMVGRKLLMNVAVSEGAEAGNTFRGYVNWLVEHEYVPVKAKEWVDEIRELGNDANHEIALMSPAAANELLEFVAMLLQLVYGYPERGRLSAKARKQAEAAANGTEG